MRLRPYKACDAETIVTWIGDEYSFRQWSADRFASYPINADDLNRHYDDMAYSDSFYQFTVFDDTGIVGHMIMRFTDDDKRTVRFGFVIVDNNKRGKGLGKKMLQLAVRYAFDILKAEKITLGVFENNIPAYKCYQSAGFNVLPTDNTEYYHVMDEDWKCIEMELLK